MCCSWCDWKRIDYNELLVTDSTMNSVKYSSWLDNLKQASDQNRSIVKESFNKITLDHMSKRWKLLKLGWDVLPYYPYSPDLAPSGYHLFRSLQYSLKGKNFNSLEDQKERFEQFFADNPWMS
ncbi:hypothetical protein AVEN_132613-1 [Araneus ventricosus]|uniref:Mariner Mos1 transposase n=1 Tax=Araneus ventricosus TaxID=182803 RepID=A0A4Y2AWY8_ARAVE|nr:hypothetical protein AVEN_132613-1 [Araneus ventricosus]